MGSPNRPRKRAPQQARGTSRPPQRAAARSARPADKPFLTPGASAFRTRVERRSAVLLIWLRALPRPVPGLLVLAVVAGGIALPGVPGAACLAVAALVLSWLSFLSWPAVKPLGRLIRVAAVLGLLALAAGRLSA